MSQGWYLAIVIILIVSLFAFSVFAFIRIRKMPAPKGCEDLEANKEKCTGCGEITCPIYSKYHKEEDAQ